MKFDDALKYACDQEVQKEDLSPEKAEEMFSHIENRVLLKKSTIRYRFISRIKAFCSSSPVISFTQVAAFILILILIPLGVKSIKKHNSVISVNPKPDVSSEKPVPNKPVDSSKKNLGPNDVKASDFNDINKVVEKGNVYTMSDVSASNESGPTVYYANRLDDFITQFNNNAKGSIFIVGYVKEGEKIWVNKFTKLESSGSSLLITGYDVYTSKEIFIADTPVTFVKILKNTTDNGIRYAAYLDKNEAADKGMTLLSYNSDKNAGIASKTDATDIENLINNYFNYLSERNYEKAWELTSDKQKLSYPKSEALKTHWGLEKITLLSLEKSVPPGPGSYASDRPTTWYIVKLDVVPNSYSYGTWGNGTTERFVNVVKDTEGNWKIDGLATGP